MTCEQAKDLIAIEVYGRLTDDQRRQLNQHLASCSSCRECWKSVAHLIVDTGVPAPDLERVWREISATVPTQELIARSRPMVRWALAAGVAVAVFALGYMAGKRFLPDSGNGYVSIAAEISHQPLTAYVDNVKPVLVNFLNREGKDIPKRLERLERQLVTDMLVATRLLKTMAEQQGDTSREALLQDLELILTAMNNLAPDDHRAAVQLSRLIQEQELPFRLQELIAQKSSL